MTNILKKLWQTGIVGTFLAGLLLLLPLALTIIILDWLVGKVVAMIGPGSLFGDLLLSGGGSIVGPNHAVLAFILGLIVVLAAIWALGLLVKSQARLQVSSATDALLGRVPLIRKIYRPVAQVVRLLSADGGGDLKGMHVVRCRLGGPHGVDLLCLAASSRIFDVTGEKRRLVYLPTSPVPMTGGLLLVDAEAVTEMPDVSVDELMQIYLSLGVIIPESITGPVGARP
jgi:uncharacterized membrane protein